MHMLPVDGDARQLLLVFSGSWLSLLAVGALAIAASEHVRSSFVAHEAADLSRRLRYFCIAFLIVGVGVSMLSVVLLQMSAALSSLALLVASTLWLYGPIVDLATLARQRAANETSPLTELARQLSPLLVRSRLGSMAVVAIDLFDTIFAAQKTPRRVTKEMVRAHPDFERICEQVRINAFVMVLLCLSTIGSFYIALTAKS